MYKYISAAEAEDPIQDLVDNLEDDFDYIIAGLDRLARMGNEGKQTRQEVVTKLQGAFNAVINEIGGVV